MTIRVCESCHEPMLYIEDVKYVHTNDPESDDFEYVCYECIESPIVTESKVTPAGEQEDVP